MDPLVDWAEGLGDWEAKHRVTYRFVDRVLIGSSHRNGIVQSAEPPDAGSAALVMMLRHNSATFHAAQQLRYLVAEVILRIRLDQDWY